MTRARSLEMIGGGWLAVLMTLSFVTPGFAQSPIAATTAPRNLVDVAFVPAPSLLFLNPTDSNSPAFWDGGAFYIFNSLGGQPRRAMGTSLETAHSTNSHRAHEPIDRGQL